MSSHFVILLLLLALLNIWTIFCFWSDKRAAISGARRTPETHLLALALIGGSPGALVARRIFRHKTRKQPFSTLLLLIVTIQIGLGIGWFLL